MKKSSIILLSIELFLCIMFLINVFVINIDNMYLISCFLMAVIFITIFLLGFEKDNKRLKKDAILNAVIFSGLLQIFLYMSGFIFGFLRNGYSTEPFMILINVLPMLLLIITQEVLRYSINQKGRESKLILIISCITFIIIECSIQGLFYNFEYKRNIIELICMVILPSIPKNIFLTYNTCKFGFTSSILYRVIMELTIYFTVIIPNISDYLNAIVYFLFPIIVLVITKNTIGKNVAYEEVVYKKVSKIPILFSIIFIITIVVLNTGLAPLYMLAIGSGSMEKTIYRGDTVIVKKINENKINTLKKEDILVYRYQDKVVVHRIHKIDFKNDDVDIITKGDNNEDPDNWIVNKNNIIGKVVFKIKYIGIPTVWLNDLLS